MKTFYTDWDEFKEAQLCNAWVATAIVGAGVIGAGATAYSANRAADAQTAAADKAANTAMSQYNTTRGDTLAYRGAGIDAATRLNQNDYYTAPIVMDQATLEKTPGYQFNLTQGNKAVANSVAARGLGVSGAALKGAANFATGLADNTYQNQFNNANTNQNNAYNRLKGILDTGENAAVGTGTIGQSAANIAAGAQIGAGDAQAAAANRTGNAISSAANNGAGGYAAYKGLYGNNNGTTNYSGVTPSQSNWWASGNQGPVQ